MNRFILKNTFIKIYIYHFSINIFIKISQSSALETVSLSKTTSFTKLEGVVSSIHLYGGKRKQTLEARDNLGHMRKASWT
jgi:hypothetical protein